jgi:succinate dehydrogenase flavin-adding protein (antitoxin of CptAB toxin-antitoxin module)
MTIRACLPLVLLAALLAACGQSTHAPDKDDRPLAVVDDVPVTVTWFNQTYVDFLIRTGSNDTRANRQAHLDNLIDSILLAAEHDRQQLDEQPDFRQFRERVEQEELGTRYFETALLDTMSAPTDAQIRRTFTRWKSQAVVSHLFFRSLEEARLSHDRLESGVPFLEEAQRVYGTTSFDSLAGYLGPIRYFNTDDAFAEAAWSLEQGAYSAPVRSRFGYHIIRLENLIQEPLLTESEYQTRRQGMSSQYRLRRRRLEGDQFIMQFMTQRNVEVNAPAVSALSDLLRSLDPAAPVPGLEESSDRVSADELRSEIDENAVLATFEWDGEREAFTAGDYAFWLDGLPFTEARDRTAASVGRAMRNALLARAGAESGLRDAEWQKEVDRRLMMEAARRMRMEFRSRPGVPDTALVQLAFERLGWHSRRQADVSFRAAIFPSRAMAEEARSAYVQTGSLPSGWEVVQTNVASSGVPEWNRHVMTAPLGVPVVIGRASDWALLLVEDRRFREVSWQDDREEIERRLAPFVREYRTIQALRASTPIQVDSTLFEDIATLPR